VKLTNVALCTIPEAVEHCLEACYREIGMRVIEHIRKHGEKRVRLQSSVEFDQAHRAQRVEVSAFLT
jgi:hypothetical protein